ncbi:hypothetical protein N183_35040 [Sinorhizobium sp. Sb3]|nr:hypothetical protein N183_35040 [Sinorhizobium sp. Sb3]
MSCGNRAIDVAFGSEMHYTIWPEFCESVSNHLSIANVSFQEMV